MSDSKSEEHWLKKRNAQYNSFVKTENALHFCKISFVKEYTTAPVKCPKVSILRWIFVFKAVKILGSAIRRNPEMFCH